MGGAVRRCNRLMSTGTALRLHNVGSAAAQVGVSDLQSQPESPHFPLLLQRVVVRLPTLRHWTGANATHRVSTNRMYEQLRHASGLGFLGCRRGQSGQRTPQLGSDSSDWMEVSSVLTLWQGLQWSCGRPGRCHQLSCPPLLTAAVERSTPPESPQVASSQWHTSSSTSLVSKCPLTSQSTHAYDIPDPVMEPDSLKGTYGMLTWMVSRHRVPSAYTLGCMMWLVNRTRGGLLG